MKNESDDWEIVGNVTNKASPTVVYYLVDDLLPGSQYFFSISIITPSGSEGPRGPETLVETTSVEESSKLIWIVDRVTQNGTKLLLTTKE